MMFQQSIENMLHHGWEVLIVIQFLLEMNKYEIMDMIDEGAYGIVWKAVNKEMGNLVAIKEFKEGDDDEISRKNIQRQIRMLKMLKGEYIVNIKEAFKKKNKIFLIFEFFPKNLLNIIEVYEHGLDSSLISLIAYKIIRCLRFLHQKNIIHRDIKPENILLHPDASELKLCDFGFARFIPDKKEDLTEYVATRWYRSPELLVGERYGKAADIWALGCIIGELVDGQPMYPGENEMDQLYLIRKSLGELPPSQVERMKRNSKYSGLAFPALKSVQPLQVRYIGKVEKQALSFMKACLALDPSKRITVEQALTHPYLLPFTVKDNEHLNEETNLLYSSRNITHRNDSKQSIKNQSRRTIHQTQETNQQPTVKTKFFADKNSLKLPGSLPQNSIYKVIHQKSNSHQLMHKKYSEANIKTTEQNSGMKKKMPAQVSPKLNLKKDSMKKMSKVMSEQKKINYNIDVKLNINLKIQQKLNKGSEMQPSLEQGKLPQIKNNKMLKYRLSTKYPGNGINTIYNSYGNLSIMGESKEISKGQTKIG